MRSKSVKKRINHLYESSFTQRRVSRIALLGSFAPRLCGIATFTADLAKALSTPDPALTVDSIAVSDRSGYDYPACVKHQITEADRDAYTLAAAEINRRRYDVLAVQHEYGIYGGDSGAYLLNLVRETKMPVVTTLHTVLRQPSESQRAVLDELLQLSERVVVMSQTAIRILSEVHGIDPAKVDFIPHGIPDVPASAGMALRERLGKDGPMVLTFGLLSPDKGIQYVIEAMPTIVAANPGAHYVIVGATHPQVRAFAGESYRESLTARVSELGMDKHVLFVDRFVSLDELIQYLSATDFYITPYLNPMQITSGTLAYSLGAGKVVLSSPYAYAEELLAEGRGILIPYRDHTAIAEAIISTFADTEAREKLGRNALEFGKSMRWSQVGNLYLDTFNRAVASSAIRISHPVPHVSEELPRIKLNHLKCISDDTGILQHANYTIPNRDEGYCVDDNARALLLTSLLERTTPLSKQVDLMQARFLSFVHHAFNPSTGKFRNFMGYDRKWLEDAGSEDSNGRSIWALGTFIRWCHDPARSECATQTFNDGMGSLLKTTSPRTWAYGILGATELLKRWPGKAPVLDAVNTLTGRLWNLQTSTQTKQWPWPERRLAYANARLPQALLEAGQLLGRPELIETGLQSLDWLMENQTTSDGIFSPIGSSGAGPEEIGTIQFDQQPLEAWSSMSACLSAFKLTEDQAWLQRAHLAFNWFLGANVLGLQVCNPETGGCRDGLHKARRNENQGAESTLAYLCALAELKLAKKHLPTAAIRMI